MKKTKRARKARRPIESTAIVRRPPPATPRERRVVRLIACVPFALGGMLLIKVAATLREGTAWDDLSSSSRQAQPLEYWAFVATYLAMAAFFLWLGVELWPAGRSRARRG